MGILTTENLSEFIGYWEGKQHWVTKMVMLYGVGPYSRVGSLHGSTQIDKHSFLAPSPDRRIALSGILLKVLGYFL